MIADLISPETLARYHALGLSSPLAPRPPERRSEEEWPFRWHDPEPMDEINRTWEFGTLGMFRRICAEWREASSKDPKQ